MLRIPVCRTIGGWTIDNKESAARQRLSPIHALIGEKQLDPGSVARRTLESTTTELSAATDGLPSCVLVAFQSL